MEVDMGRIAEYLRGWERRNIIDDMPKCKVCGTYLSGDEEDKCDCWVCSGCGEGFSDHDMLGNKEKWLCIHCEDDRYCEETGDPVMLLCPL